jgi:hypothetical protein
MCQWTSCGRVFATFQGMVNPKTEPDKFEQAAKAIRRSLPELLATIVARFERELPDAGADIQSTTHETLADHTVTLIAEITTILTGMKTESASEESSPYLKRQREMLLADGSTVYSVLGELHGRQRRNFPWTEKALNLEYRILVEELCKTAQKGSLTGSEEPEVTAVIRRILVEARDHSLRTYCQPARAR